MVQFCIFFLFFESSILFLAKINEGLKKRMHFALSTFKTEFVMLFSKLEVSGYFRKFQDKKLSMIK